MRRLVFVAVLLVSIPLVAQDARRSGDWTPFPGVRECIGGAGCTERRLRVPLEDRPVVAVRFTAHDDIGSKADGELRVKIDGNTIRDRIDIPRRGETFTLDVDELRGRYLVFEPARNDEVEISNIAVLYARETIRRPGPRGPQSGGGWRDYPRASACIGGDGCRKNGTRITIALDPLPVLGIRFWAHDAIGQRADGKVNVRVDDLTVASYVDIRREGRRHEFEVASVSGTRLVIETASNDEVEVSEIQVLYGRPVRGGGSREIRNEGACIGGDQCGGRRARIRIALDGRAVESIRFYAHDDIGTKASGKLQIRIDDQFLEYSLDIPREGRTFTIAAKGAAGDYLYFEPAANDEIEIKDIRVQLDD
ncbi:MAG TPA: hypothetical protein VF701_02095 [Thermoanaerobaculia bacterium]